MKLLQRSKDISKYLLVSTIIIFMLNNVSFIDKKLILCLSLFFMSGIVFINILDYKRCFNKKFFINNFLAIIFLIVQFIIFIFFRFSLTTMSLYFNEFFFIFVIYLLAIRDKEDVNFFYKTFVITTFIFNVISIIFCILSLYDVISLQTYTLETNSYVTGIYSNPNGMGIITAVSLFIYFSYFFRKDKLYSYLFVIFNLLIIYLSNCRTAILIIPFYVIFYIVTEYHKKLIKPIITMSSIFLILVPTIYFGYMYINRHEKFLNKYESKINSILTHRYVMGKYSLLSLNNKLYVGIENNDIAKKRYNSVPETIKREMVRSEINIVYENNNNHNSYIQVIVNFGLIIYILFLLIIIKGLNYTYYKNLPIILSILVLSFFEGQLTFSKGIIMLLFIILLADKYKEKYIPNSEEVLYINYIDMEDKSSGSNVRPNKIYEAFLKKGYKVKMLTGTILKQNKKDRINNVRKIEKWLRKNKPKFCYIESPSEPIIYREDRNLIYLIHYYNIPTSYFYRDCYYFFPKIYIFKNIKLNFKNLLKYIYNLVRYIRDIIVLKRTIDIVYFPSVKMTQYFNFNSQDILPPGCELYESSKGNCIIYVGALSENYGTDLMFQAMKIVNKTIDLKLLLVCREKEFLKYKEQCKNYSWLEVHHVSGKAQLEKMYSKSKIALMPKKKNKYNDFAISVKFFEYVSYDLPIIATSCYETDQIIKNNNLGLICKENAYDFAEKIIELYTNKSLYLKKVDAIKKYKKINTWDDRIKKIELDFINGDYYEKN